MARVARTCRVASFAFLWMLSASHAGQSSAADDLYSVSPGTVDAPDIVWSKTIPVVGDEIKISATVRGQGPHPVPVRFVLSSGNDTPVTITGTPNPPEEGGRSEYHATWRPTKAAVYHLTVQVDPEKQSADSVPQNNTATVVIPVVWRELHVISWASTKYMKWVTTAIVPSGQLSVERATPELRYWRRRGRRVLGIVHPLEREVMKLPEQTMVKQIVKEAEDYARAGADGVIIDETGSYATPDGLEYIRRFGVAMDKVKATLPQLKVYNWISGPLHRPEIEIGARNGHIMVGECYDPLHATHGPTWRTRLQHYASTLGPNNIIALGTGKDCGRQFEPWVENSVRMIRELEPNMPGICYYIIDDSETYEGGYNEFLDGLTFKYFIGPVITLAAGTTGEEYLDTAPLQIGRGPVKPGEIANLRLRLRNIGGMPAHNVGVKFYARDRKSGERALISSAVIPQIGNGAVDIVEKQASASTEKLLDGVLHPMGRFADTSRVVLEQAIQPAQWTPQKGGPFTIEAEVQPSAGYTILNGYAERDVEVSNAPAPPPTPTVAVTTDDILLSQWPPKAQQSVSVQVCLHNIHASGAAAENVPVSIYVRCLETNERSLLQRSLIKKIGTDITVIEEDHAPSLESKVIDGVKHPIARDRNQSKVFLNRALLDASWTPARQGYYRIEVEIEPANQFAVREGQGRALKTVPVAE